MNDDKLQEERKDYDDLLFKYNQSKKTIRELEETVKALLYSLRQSNIERLDNKYESMHFQKMYNEENKRANRLFDIVEKLDIDAYEGKQNGY